MCARCFRLGQMGSFPQTYLEDSVTGVCEIRMLERELTGLSISYEEAGPIIEDLDPFGWMCRPLPVSVQLECDALPFLLGELVEEFGRLGQRLDLELRLRAVEALLAWIAAENFQLGRGRSDRRHGILRGQLKHPAIYP
jgi:hypothetical protein